MWLAQLTRSISRDEKLHEALKSIKKNKDAEIVAARLALAKEEADALVAEGAQLPADEPENDEMTAELEAELAELAEMEDSGEVEDAGDNSAVAAPAPVTVAPPATTATGAAAEVAHKSAQLERCKEARAAAFERAEQAMLDNDTAQTAAWVSKVEKLDAYVGIDITTMNHMRP